MHAGDADIDTLQAVGWQALLDTELDTGNVLVLGGCTFQCVTCTACTVLLLLMLHGAVHAAMWCRVHVPSPATSVMMWWYESLQHGACTHRLRTVQTAVHSSVMWQATSGSKRLLQQCQKATRWRCCVMRAGDGLEFRVGGDGALGAARKALPAGTVRKWVPVSPKCSLLHCTMSAWHASFQGLFAHRHML